MTRKKLVTALSIIYIINGLWDIGVFLSPLSVSSGSIDLDLAPLISGALALYVGFHLFQLHDFGRKFAIVLLYVRVAINSIFIVWSLFYVNGVSGSRLYFLEKLIYRTDNPYASQVWLFAWIIIALLTIAFLSHEETKKVFVPETKSDSDVIIEST